MTASALPIPFDLDAWARRNHMPAEGMERMRLTLESEPDHTVRPGTRNPVYKYASRKMRRVIQANSKLELFAIIGYEYEPEVVAFLEQPRPKLWLRYLAANGRNKHFLTTPDFFVVERSWAGYHEWKDERRLADVLAGHDPIRFVQERGGWRCPPGEAAAGRYGLGYRLRSSAEIPEALTHNRDLLADYFDHPGYRPPAAARDRILAIVRANPGITLADLVAMLR